MKRLISAVALLLCVGLASPAHAQFDPSDVESFDDLARALQFVGNRYADSYVQPITDAFGSGMNAGLFRTASKNSGLIPKLDIYVGAYVSGAFLNDNQKAFDARFTDTTPSGDFSLTVNGQSLSFDRFEITVDGEDLPTAFGERDSPQENVLTITPLDESGNPLIDPSTGDPITLRSRAPAGLVDTPIAPLVMPQVAVGTILGTSAQLRYLPTTEIDEYGTIGLFGLAVKHSLSQYIPALPLNLAVQGAYNTLTLESSPAISGVSSDAAGSEVFDSSGWAFNLQASKNIPILPITFYGGLQYESFDTEYNYVFDPTGGGGSFAIDDPIEISLDQSASNRVRGVAGVSITLAIIRVNADYALSNNDAVTVGVGLQL